MKKSLLLSLSIFCSLSVFSQNEFAPDGAEWYYTSFFGWLGDGATHVELTGDTTINNQSYKTLTLRYVTENHDFSEDAYIRQSADSVFRYYQTGEIYLFKTKMEIGEIHSFPSLAGENAEFEVMEEEIQMVNGQEVRMHLLKRINSSWDLEVKFYDRYGPEYGFMDFWLGSASDGNDHYLQCYSDDEFDLFNFTNEECGGQLINDTEEAGMDFLKIYPNPVGEQLTFELTNGGLSKQTITVFDAVGRSINLLLEDNQVNVSQLAAGWYTGSIKIGEAAKRFKFVKIR